MSSAESSGTFACSNCPLTETYHYYGKQPPFNNKIRFKEDCYIMKDPFSPPIKRQVFVLGSKCSLCSSVICHGSNCSIFYTKRFCTNCVRDNIREFPIEIQKKVSKMAAEP